MDVDWLALLFIIFALAIFFSSIAAPQYVLSFAFRLTSLPTPRGPSVGVPIYPRVYTSHRENLKAV